MKVTLFAAAAVLLAIAPARAGWVIESKIESPQINSTVITKLDGQKVRADIASGPMGAMSSIIDTTSGEAIQLIHAQKMAMKTSAAQMKQMMEMAKKMAGANQTSAPSKPTATGEKEKVGEFDCEIWTWSSGDVSAKYWVALKHPYAEGLKAMEKQMREGALGGAQMGVDPSELPGPAIKTETTAMGTKTTTTVTSVKEQSIDAKEFAAPADYQVIGMPSAPGAPAAPGGK